jgi:hypothetical protein
VRRQWCLGRSTASFAETLLVGIGQLGSMESDPALTPSCRDAGRSNVRTVCESCFTAFAFSRLP